MKRILILLLFSFKTFAVAELDFDFSYSKNKYGSNRQNYNMSRTYSGSIAFYLFNLTAIEFNYSESNDKAVVNHDTSKATNLAIETETSVLKTSTYGVGIRQALANKNSFLIPTLSFGWARQSFSDSASATIIDKSDNSRTIYETGESVITYDSVFASFGLKFRLTKTFYIKGGVKTAFRAFEWNQAKDQLNYSAGLSWIF